MKRVHSWAAMSQCPLSDTVCSVCLHYTRPRKSYIFKHNIFLPRALAFISDGPLILTFIWQFFLLSKHIHRPYVTICTMINTCRSEHGLPVCGLLSVRWELCWSHLWFWYCRFIPSYLPVQSITPHRTIYNLTIKWTAILAVPLQSQSSADCLLHSPLPFGHWVSRDVSGTLHKSKEYSVGMSQSSSIPKCLSIKCARVHQSDLRLMTSH